MKRNVIVSMIAMLFMSFALTACASGDDAIEGRYTPVIGEMIGVAMPGDTLDFIIDLTSDGKGTMTISGEPSELTWKLEDTKMKFVVDGKEMVAEHGTNSLVFDDMFGMGMKVSFAKEGSDAHSPEFYLPESDQYLVGTWKSVDVTDIFGETVDPNEMKPDALQMVLRGDYTGDVTIVGKEYKDLKWKNEIDIGEVLSQDVSITWGNVVGGLIVEYVTDNNEHYIFYCPKEE